jgi:hypothetical protein
VKILKIILICLSLAQFKVFSQNNIINSLDELSKNLGVLLQVEEKEKWQLVGDYFTTGMDTLKISQKIGKFLNNYSAYVIWPLVVLCTGTVVSLDHSYVGLFRQFDKLNEIISRKCTKTNRGYRYFKNGIGFTGAAIEIGAISLLFYFLLNYGLQFGGKKLEDKEGRSFLLLSAFVKNWEKNKALTPAALMPIFEQLVADDNFAKIDKVLVEKIVESIIATALIASSIE